MFTKPRREIARLRKLLTLADARLKDARTHVGILTANQARMAQRQATLVWLIAETVTTVAARPDAKAVADHLQQQLRDAGFRAELEYALLHIQRTEAAS